MPVSASIKRLSCVTPRLVLKPKLRVSGANLLAYRVPVKGRLFDVTDGFQTPDELEAGKGGLEVTISGKNVGDASAFFGCGWHPYFRASEDGIEKLRLVIPSKGRIAVGDRLLPLAGAAAFVDMESAPDLDFRPNRPNAGNVIAGRVLDGAYRELIADSDGLARSYIENPETGLRVSVFQECGLMHIYTGDGVPERKRVSVALEPVEFMTNAINRPECAKDIVLAPGTERKFHFGIEAGL
jgi:aldose 1-epimerase